VVFPAPSRAHDRDRVSWLGHEESSRSGWVREISERHVLELDLGVPAGGAERANGIGHLLLGVEQVEHALATPLRTGAGWPLMRPGSRLGELPRVLDECLHVPRLIAPVRHGRPDAAMAT